LHFINFLEVVKNEKTYLALTKIVELKKINYVQFYVTFGKNTLTNIEVNCLINQVILKKYGKK
jgi:hypothetical protein